MKPFDKELRKRITREYIEGADAHTLAAQYGVNYRTIYGWSQKAGHYRNNACERREAEMPRYRRCDQCQGMEDTTHPHEHAA